VGFNEFSVGSNSQSFLGFNLYFDKGKDKFMQEFAKLTKEEINLAILNGIDAAMTIAKNDLTQGFKGLVGATDIDSVGRGKFARGRFTKIGAQDAGVNLVGNNKKNMTAIGKILNSLGYVNLDKRARYIRVKAGSFDPKDTIEPTGVLAESNVDLNPMTTENRKPQGGFNLAVAYEGGVRPFKYNFKNTNIRGITPTRTAEFDAKPGSVLIKANAIHPGFESYGIVGRFQELFRDNIDTQIVSQIDLAFKRKKSIALNGSKFTSMGGY
jgi:hypothetical protein